MTKKQSTIAGIAILVSFALCVVSLINIDNGAAFPWLTGLGAAGFIGGIALVANSGAPKK